MSQIMYGLIIAFVTNVSIPFNIRPKELIAKFPQALSDSFCAYEEKCKQDVRQNCPHIRVSKFGSRVTIIESL